MNPDVSVRQGHAISKAVKHKLMKEGPDIVDVLTHLEPYDEILDSESLKKPPIG